MRVKVDNEERKKRVGETEVNERTKVVKVGGTQSGEYYPEVIVEVIG